MKRYLCILMACILFLPVCSAETAMNDAKLVHWGVTAAGRMVEKTLSNTKIPTALWKTWKEIDVSHPGKALVIILADSQAETACSVLGIKTFSEAVPVLADTINHEFWDLYAENARLVMIGMDGINLDSPVLVVLAYGNHLVAASCAQGSMQASFIISDDEVSENLDQTTIQRYTDQLGLSEPEIRIYEGEALKNLLAASE